MKDKYTSPSDSFIVIKDRTIRMLKEYDLYQPLKQYCAHHKMSMNFVIENWFHRMGTYHFSAGRVFNQIYPFIAWCEIGYNYTFIRQLLGDDFDQHINFSYYDNVSAILFLALIYVDILLPLELDTKGFHFLIFTYIDMILEDADVNLYALGQVNDKVLSRIKEDKR